MVIKYFLKNKGGGYFVNDKYPELDFILGP